MKAFGMRSVSGDDAFLTINKDGDLFRMTVLHVDDFLVAGNPHFMKMMSSTLKNVFTFGKTEFDRFKFTGLNIEQTEERNLYRPD